MCLDPALAIQCGDRPPPLYVCIDCVDQLRREHAQFLYDILRPLEKVSLTCENKVLKISTWAHNSLLKYFELQSACNMHLHLFNFKHSQTTL